MVRAGARLSARPAANEDKPAMPGKKPAARRRQSAMALRKRPPPQRTGRPAIALGVLNQRLGYFARRVQVWIFQDFIRRLAALDLSPAQFSVLVVTGANAGLSQAELSATLGIERARLVRLLHRLEQRGLTQRLPSSADGRRHALRLTPEGQRVLARAKALSDQHEAGLVKRFGPERYRLLIEALREF
jgi:DNA-binding MarR family transcriptional regulator